MENNQLHNQKLRNKVLRFLNPPSDKRLSNYSMLGILVLVLIILILWFIDQITTDPVYFLRSLSFSIIYGLSFSMLLFIFVSGFYLIFGLAGIINFAHGSFFMLGGFIGYVVYIFSEEFLLSTGLFATNHFLLSLICFMIAIIGTCIIMGLMGAGIEIMTIRRLYGNAIGQILLTIGFLFIILKMVEIIFGPPINTFKFVSGSSIRYFFLPESQVINLGNGFSFSLYRIGLIFIGLVLAIVMFLILTKTKIGLIIQAGIEDPEMVEALGINTRRMFFLVFIAGVALAGFAGVIAVPDLGATLSNGTDFLLYAFVIVVIGGAHYGRLEGTFYASLIVGLSYTFATYFLSGWGSVIIFLIMGFILIFKPGGLTGEE